MACVAGVLTPSAQAVLIKRAMQPSISPNGETIVFSWQGDLWRVASQGGRAERLTVHPAMDANPRWTADGSRILFSSNRFGSNDVYSIEADGGDLRRLTFDSASEIATHTSPDGRFVYGYTSAFGRQDLFRVPITGGDIVQLTDHPLEFEFLPAVSPDGRTVVYSRGAYGVRGWQKPGVQSSALPSLWVADNTVPLSNHRALTRDERTATFANWGPDGTIYFISNRSGSPNVWRMGRDGAGARQLTKHTDGTARYLSVSSDGRTGVYEFNSELYRINLANGETKKLSIEVAGDARTNLVVDLTLTDRLSDFAIAPDGKRAAIQVRGEIFVIPERGGTTRRLTTSPALDSHPVWLDNKTILYTKSGLNSKRELATVTVDGQHKEFLRRGEDVAHPVVSPDGKTVAFHMGQTQIALIPAAGGAAKPIVRGNFTDALDGAQAFTWSPDSKWLVAAVAQDRATNIVLVEVDSGRQVVVARMPRGTSTPKFTPNGKAVYFIAFDGRTANLFIVDLVPAEVRFSEDDLDKLDEPAQQPGQRAPVKVEIQESGIENRLRRLTSDSTVDAQASPDGRTIWANVQGALVAIPAAGGPSRPVEGVTGSAVGLTLANNNLYFVSGGRLNALSVAGPPAVRPIPYSAELRVDLREEEKALFDEIWWAIDRFYYDETFHGKNWGAIKQKFAQVVPFTYDRADFYSLMGEMMEELDSSHLGATSPPEDAVPGFGNESTGYIGVDWNPQALAEGRYVIAKVYAGTPADHPQTQLKVGDQVTAVDGVAPSNERPMASLLMNKSGRRVRLTVQRDGKPVDVAIRPTSSALRTSTQYQDWVEDQRRRVDQLSNGQLAYIHIPGMDQTSLENFRRDIRTRTQGKKGLVIDVRYNGGGSTAQDILNLLIKQPWLIRTTRGPEGIRQSENIFRGDSVELPAVTLINSYSFSNAEVWAEGFRQLKLGTIVGERTPGYVIGTGAYGLWDGGQIRMPSIGAYTINGENLENNGRKPDIAIPFDPNAWQQGRDPQLERAVREILRQIR